MESPSDKKLESINMPKEEKEDEEKEEENKEKENTKSHNIININTSELKKPKRRNSSNVKNYKINSNNKIENIIPKIYNDISQKVIIPKIKNNSMKKIRPKMIEEIKIDIKNENHKKIKKFDSYLFQSIIKIRKGKSPPQLLDEQWYFEKILLDYNLIDFTCKIYNIIINFIKH